MSQRPADGFDVVRMNNFGNYFNLFASLMVTSLHKVEVEELHSLGTKVAFVQIHLHSGLLDVLEDFVEDAQVFIKLLPHAMKNIIDVGFRLCFCIN